ncbi:ribosome maturation factor RimP [Dokdonella sp.]|uniref:ribosome maturation factor RimP n=1 Tax=Dokdonella sp. TaxID=2291710 RepID=UPI003C5D89B7
MTNEKLNELLNPLVSDLGLEFVGIEFSPSRGSSLLRVYIDAPGRPVAIEDCERVSREISALMDVNDPIEGRYTLEVSSPGIDRPLFTLEHFVRFVGCTVKLNVALPVDGRHRFQGEVLSVEDDRIHLDQDGKEVVISHANVVKAKLIPDYEALGISAAPKKKADTGSRKRDPKHK